MAAVKELLLETLMDLNHSDLGSFKIFLNFESFQNKFPQISWSDLRKSNCKNVVDLLMSTYGQQCLEVTRQVLTDMNRTDLLENLPEKSCGAEGNGVSSPPTLAGSYGFLTAFSSFYTKHLMRKHINLVYELNKEEKSTFFSPSEVKSEETSLVSGQLESLK